MLQNLSILFLKNFRPGALHRPKAVERLHVNLGESVFTTEGAKQEVRFSSSFLIPTLTKRSPSVYKRAFFLCSRSP